MIDLRRVRARATVGELPPEDMPGWAATALEAGLDSPGLRALAGVGLRDVQEIRDLFDLAMQELGAPRLTLQQAQWEAARGWAEAIVAGRVPPYEAPRQLWALWIDLGQPEALTPFVGAASEWEDDSAHRAEYETDMLDAARRFLGLR